MMTAKFKIKKSQTAIKQPYYWVLVDTNGEAIAHHEMYASKQGCRNGILNVINAIQNAELIDESGEKSTYKELPLVAAENTVSLGKRFRRRLRKLLGFTK